MFRQYGIGAGLSLLILSSTAQAAPLINVISDHLQLSSYAQLVDSHGTPQRWESNYSGRALSGDREVIAFDDWIYTEEHTDCCGTIYDEFAVTALSRSTGGSDGVDLLARSFKYSSAAYDVDTPPETYFTSVELGALATVDWRFKVSGGDVELVYWVADEHLWEGGTYPAGWTESLSSITIFDESEGKEILDVAGMSDGWTNLLDGHTYRLHATSRDDHFPGRSMSESNVYTGMFFTEAEVAYVDEPPVLVLIGFGLLSLISVRRLGRGFSQVSMS